MSLYGTLGKEGSFSQKAIQTQLRDRTTSRDDFIFLATRLARLLIEHSMSLVPFTPITVKTPTGWAYEGVASQDLVRFSPSS